MTPISTTPPNRPLDLTIQHAQLPERSGLWDVAIANGVITAITPSSVGSPSSAISVTDATNDATNDATVIDAARRLLIPGLVDAHIHLDKALLLERSPAQEGNFTEAMRETSQLKQSFTAEDIQARARRVIERSIALGVTAMRGHVEVDQTIGLTGMEALLPLQTDYAWGLTLQLAVFAQEGITDQPGIVELLHQALHMGGNVIGSAPYTDPDPERNVQIVFDIAQAHNCDVDFHLDFLDDDRPLLLPFVVEETIRRGWQGRVCLGHMTKLAALPPDRLQDLAPMLKTAGISILALPATDLYMMARNDTHNVRRGVAPIHTLADLGVTVGLATNNIQNLFTPFGDGDVLKIGTLLAQVLHLGTTARHEQCLKFATTEAARSIGISNHGLEVGNVADLVLLNASSVSDAIGSAPVERLVIKRGQPIVQTKLEKQWLAPAIASPESSPQARSELCPTPIVLNSK